MENETSDTRREQPGGPLGDEAEAPEREPDTPAEPAAASEEDDDLAWAGPPGSPLRYLTLQEHAGPISGL